VVHHTTSPSTQAMLESILVGARTDEVSGVDVVAVAALHATAVDVLDADGFLLATPVNIGYMSGALKHFFDQMYYPCLNSRRGAPYGLALHSNGDPTGALRAVQAITTGLGWVESHEPLVVRDTPAKDDLQRCWDLGATMAALLEPEPQADTQTPD
ncbi:MAG: hypothetical protein JWM76_3127, partial [Pseudonocardiales bacterium]|nr:hypothetical protein [Pseudonocardiales bacterium]